MSLPAITRIFEMVFKIDLVHYLKFIIGSLMEVKGYLDFERHEYNQVVALVVYVFKYFNNL